jgi:hypothetical protein
MKCERGEYVVDVNFSRGSVDKTYCCETEQDALEKAKNAT